MLGRTNLINFLLVGVVYISLLLCSCNRGSEDSDSRYLNLRIVHGAELAQYLGEMKAEFLSLYPRLADGTKIRIELVNETDILGAKKIADGELKTDAWLSPSSALVNFTNSRLENLGPRQIECRELFSTPIVIAVQKGRDGFLSPQNQTFSWNSFMRSLPASPGDAASNSTIISVSHTLPTYSATGLSSLIELAYLASPGRDTLLSLETLRHPEGMKNLRRFESLISSYSMRENVLLQKTASSQTSRSRLAIATEQEVALHNMTYPNQQLTPLYPSEGSFWKDYRICLSDADWVTAAHRAALKNFFDFLSTEKAQLAIKKLGFRPSMANIGDVPPLSDKFGIRLSYPTSSFPPVSGQIVSTLIESWRGLIRPSAVVTVLDTSASMEGTPIQTGKNLYREILARNRAEDLKALVSFSTEPKIVSPFTKNTSKMIQKLDSLQSIGGSAVYDGIKTSLDLCTTEELLPYRKTILLYTDGDDKNSNLSLAGLLGIAEQRILQYDIQIIIIAVSKPGVDFSDLKKIAESTDGTFRLADIEKMPSIFQEVEALL